MTIHAWCRTPYVFFNDTTTDIANYSFGDTLSLSWQLDAHTFTIMPFPWLRKGSSYAFLFSFSV